ncbi:hypothetical protein SAMN05421819_2666 [Bryocella elongata]|uniref:Uncharacterized protein n=1 Tax=Bryocella elongata TaxID=863522 RepID=A0A1H5ZHK3_9BACT|nr:hypothetical protein [Bryocella elongata]SEG35939.1 hypothetical protein SAMN05421819_2666 [Bryocella elongata]
MRTSKARFTTWLMLSVGAVLPASSATPPSVKAGAGACSQVRVEAQVTAGHSFEQVFAQGQGGGLKLVVQALASGWIVRVVPSSGPWGEHDRAELATPPYLSPNPLLITTDFAFRAQDAVAWNPRHFRYAASDGDYRKMLELYPRVMSNDAAAMSELAKLSTDQPEGEVRILDAMLAPGTADQWRMAAAVASHLESTPHEVAQGAASSKLGSLVSAHLRITMEVPRGLTVSKGLATIKIPCVSQPTG